MENNAVKVVEDRSLSKSNDKRYIVIDKETGEILDTAQGYGYKSVQKAYAAWNYKNRDKSKDKEKSLKKKQILKWMRENKEFVSELDGYAFAIAKGGMAPDDKINAAFVKKMLEERGLTPDFTAGDFLRVWRKR